MKADKGFRLTKAQARLVAHAIEAYRSPESYGTTLTGTQHASLARAQAELEKFGGRRTYALAPTRSEP